MPKLKEMIVDYEMSVVPRSLITVDGSLYIPTDKASFMHAVEGAKTETAPATVPDIAMAEYPIQIARVLIVEAMAVLQCTNKTPRMRKISDLSEVFIKRIEGMMVGYDEGRSVFDRFIDQSLKNQTVTSTKYEKHSEMKFTMSLQELLSAYPTKSSLTVM